MGKSELALQFLHLNRQSFTYKARLRFDGEEHLRQDLTRLASKLKIPLAENDSLETIREKIYQRLTKPSKRPWCLILDGVDKKLEKAFIPSQGGVVLITSQEESVIDGNATQTWKIEALAMDEAMALFRRITGEETSEEMHQLAHSLECFPFAIYQVASYIRESGISIAKYLATFDAKKPLHLPASPNIRYKHVLGNVWDITLEKLKEENPLAAEWLNFCTFLSPTEIADELLEQWLEKQGKPREEAIKILRSLRQYGLIRPLEEESFSLHHLLQEVVQYKQDKTTRKKLAQEVFDFLQDQIKTSLQSSNPDLLEKGNCYLPHISFFMRGPYWNRIPIKERLDIVNYAWEFTRRIHKYDSSLEFAEIGYTLGKSSSEEEWKQEMKIDFANKRACSLTSLGKYEEALFYSEKALDKYKTFFTRKNKENHYLHSTTYITLATIQYFLDQNRAALNLFLHALPGLEKIYGEKSPVVATTMCHISNTYLRLGRQQEALDYAQKALEIQKTFSSIDNPELLSHTYTTVALVLDALGKFSEAHSYHIEALNICKRLYKTENAMIATALYNLACNLGKLGKHSDALKFYLEALDIYKKALGEPHFLIALSLNGVAQAISDLDIHQNQALEYCEQALSMLKEIYKKKENSNIFESLSLKGLILLRQNKFKEAFLALEEARVMAIQLRCKSRLIYERLGKVLEELGLFSEAEKNYLEALTILLRKQDKNSLEVLQLQKSLRNLRIKQRIFEVFDPFS